MDDEIDDDELDDIDEAGDETEVVYEVVEDEDDDEEFDEGDESADEAATVEEQALEQKGRDDRTFYDDLAKDADTKRHALEKNIATSSLYLNDAKTKLAKKEHELKELMQKIAEAKERETALGQKAYRKKALAEEDVELREHGSADDGAERHLGILGDNPLTETEKVELSESIADTERRTQVLVSDIKELEPQKARLEAEIAAMRAAINEKERALSLERHNLARMV